MPYVFGYGSLVDRTSVEATIRRPLDAEDVPRTARLRGYRRAWNSANHSGLRPEYVLTDPDGAPWAGWLVWLGLVRDDDAVTPGAVVRLPIGDVELLDRRESGYDRVVVTDLLDLPLEEPAYTYLPKPRAVSAADAARGSGVVMARYLRLVDRGYARLGEETYAEHLATLPATDGFLVQEVGASLAVPDGHTEVIDPVG